jgi:hypothetical protein
MPPGPSRDAAFRDRVGTVSRKRLKKRKTPGRGSSVSSAVGNARRRRFAVAAVPVAIAVGLLIYLLAQRAPEPEEPAAAAGPIAASPAPEAEARPPDPTRLVGRWQRTDGGYVLEVRGVAADSSVEVGYFNPKPIHVASARATGRDGLGLFVELRDAGYPGSTYDLSYAPGPDRLLGIYFQAAIGQSFDVEFRKLPNPPARP